MSHPTARKERARNTWPVVAAGIFVNFRRPAKIAPDDDGHIFVQPAFVEISNQCMHALIKVRQMLLHHFEVIAMPVPEAIRHMNQPCTRFDQPASREELFVKHRGCIPLHRGDALAVACADLWVFLVEVHRVDELTGCQDVVRFLRKRVETFEGVNFAAVGIQ